MKTSLRSTHYQQLQHIDNPRLLQSCSTCTLPCRTMGHTSNITLPVNMTLSMRDTVMQPYKISQHYQHEVALLM